MRTERYELREEPAAAGEWRGGMGMVRVNRFLVDTLVTCEGERQDGDRPWGVFGGHDGLNAATINNEGMDGEEPWPAKFTAHRLRARDTLTLRVPSSGGYGDPLDRDPERVLSDVLDEFTTVDAAERAYGVVIDAGTMTIDHEATRALRERRRSTVEHGSPAS
jgi:5-oxoprolinase (ATP-hydrolysing)